MFVIHCVEQAETFRILRRRRKKRILFRACVAAYGSQCQGIAHWQITGSFLIYDTRRPDSDLTVFKFAGFFVFFPCSHLHLSMPICERKKKQKRAELVHLQHVVKIQPLFLHQRHL